MRRFDRAFEYDNAAAFHALPDAQRAALMKRFSLTVEQTDAILDLRLYRLAKLEILIVRKELAEKRRRAWQHFLLLQLEEGSGDK